MKFQAPKGTHDILPANAAAWQRLESIVRTAMQRFGYEEIRTPIFEDTALFARSVGETTDIVKKEMYTFADRKGRSLTLRPEGTAPVARAFVEHHLGRGHDLVKLFYMGPMFRYERPQAGRFRQFHQFGAEAIGSADPAVDVDVIILFCRVLEAAGISGVSVSLNSVGDATCRPARIEAIRAALLPHRADLCADCQDRLDRNPLRILDCKVPKCREIAASIPTGLEYLCEACREHLSRVDAGLSEAGIAHRVDTSIVRGLDYYTRTAFEIHHGALGAQSALGGGGRYDGLIGDVGGAATPGIGFAAGMERILTVLGEGARAPGPLAVFVPLGDAEEAVARRLMYETRRFAHAEIAAGAGGLAKKLRAADQMRARFAVIIGDEERARGEVLLKEMSGGEQSRLAEAMLLETLRARGEETREEE
ncbi:MAG: histidine--tRNA ligase [bacterium]